MKLRRVIIHNFRSIENLQISLEDYALLVGENNVGKTSMVTALRAFYENEGAKFDGKVDLPKFPTADTDSWIELHFATGPEEQEGLKAEYRSSDGVLRVRRYFHSADRELVKPQQSNIYGYEGGTLSKNLFYGAKNVSEAKLGTVLWIPEISTADDNLKVSGPSPFRDVVNLVMKTAVQGSPTFKELQTAIESFNTKFKAATDANGLSVDGVVREINAQLMDWKIEFGVDLRQLRPEDVVKTLLDHYIKDSNLEERVRIGSFGQGLQRHLIYTLIRVNAEFASRSTAAKKDKPRKGKDGPKKEFSPDYTLVLFEEPEAFLHPSQQNKMNADLRTMARLDDKQVLVTTHSPHFVSKNVREMTSLVRLCKAGPRTSAYQLNASEVDALFSSNAGLYEECCRLLSDPKTSSDLKSAIKKKRLGDAPPQTVRRLEEEAVRYCLWLDAERASMVFAKHVVVCEGASEKALFDYLVDRKWADVRDRHVHFVDAFGKFNIHRYMSLLSSLGIPHSVLMDGDEDESVHKVVNDFITRSRTSLTKEMHVFPKDLEGFLGIPPPDSQRGDLKPLNILRHAESGGIAEPRIAELRAVLDKLIGSGGGKGTATGSVPKSEA
ncbi:MAG: AAA family ATPase [Acidobacteria bacterium]|nr:AAA family ATPase [Acidobacteriota bacterium]